MRPPLRARRAAGSAAKLLALLAILFVVQTGLAPYDFLAPASHAATGRLLTVSIDRLTRLDILSNIFLYIPLGCFGCAAWHARERRSATVIRRTLLLAVGLSLCVECVQSLSPTRVSSLLDVVANALGAGVGAYLWATAGRLVPAFVDAMRAEFALRPRGAIVKTYAVVLCATAAAPFDLSLDVGHLRESWKRARASLVEAGPVQAAVADWFAASWSEHPHDVVSVSEPARTLGIRSEQQRWIAQKRWARWGAEGISFVALGCLLVPWLHRELGFRRWASATLGLWIGTLLAFGLGILQFPILSRGFDATDPVARIVGLMIGCALGTRNRFSQSAGWAVRPDAGTPGHLRWMPLLGILTLVYIVATGIIPIGLDLGWTSQALSVATWIPFATYPLGPLDEHVMDAMEKFGAYALLAFLWMPLRGTLRPPPPATPSSDPADGYRIPGGESAPRRGAHLDVGRPSFAPRIAACGLIATAIEIAQCAIPPRTPSITDVLLAVAGAGVGCLASDRVSTFLLDVGTFRSRTGRKRSESGSRPPEFTPLDELIATLAEPKSGAPQEAASPMEPTPHPGPR